MSNFNFDAATHTYTRDGKKLLSGTQIIKICGIIDDSFYTAASRMRGVAVHKACELLAKGVLDWQSVHPKILGRVKAFEKFCSDFKWKPTACEVPIYHPTYLYGTTPDQADEETLVELKTGTIPEWADLQTALQAMALWPTDYFKKQRIAVELRDNGTYWTKHFTNPNDFNVAVAAIAIANYKTR